MATTDGGGGPGLSTPAIMTTNRYGLLTDLGDQVPPSQTADGGELAAMRREISDLRRQLADMADLLTATREMTCPPGTPADLHTGDPPLTSHLNAPSRASNKPHYKKKQWSTFNPTDYRTATPYNRYHVINVQSDRRDLCPFVLEKDLARHLGDNPLAINSGGKDTFVVEVSSAAQSARLEKLSLE